MKSHENGERMGFFQVSGGFVSEMREPWKAREVIFFYTRLLRPLGALWGTFV